MKIRTFGDNLWQLTRLAVFNAYLVREDDGLTVIDTSLAGSGKDILQAAEAIGLPITRLGLTHAHTDHVGALDELSSALPEAEISFGERTAQFLQGELALQPDEPQAELRGGFVRRETEPTRLLAQGDMLGSLRVVQSPGHSPDHIAFFDERDGTLIAGDAFQTQGGIAVAGVRRWLFPLPASATWHLPTALESAQDLRALNPTRLAVGHGRLLENPAEAMDRALAAAEAALRG
ncbi:MAG TPA: MBL fold metallo-hydrolase [Candidatus Sulfomarinibacteraceae bacterium]|nr:MBL fold metallo-hydrolase [Candidatus Sulfomarinibacteraceae bacterium]